jgi:hypothetical protein
MTLAVVLMAACQGSHPEERATFAPTRPRVAVVDAGAQRTAGVLGGLSGPDAGPIPGFPPLQPYDACQERIARVRQLACKAAVDRDGPKVTAVRDAILSACGSGGAAALACLQKAGTFDDAARCPRQPAPMSPGDCEAIRLHLFSLALVDRACPRDGPFERDMEHFMVNRLGGFVAPEPWATTCGKQSIPRRVLRCLLDSTTEDESARCGL